VKDKCPHLWVGVLGDATLADLPDGTLVSADGLAITKADIDSEIAKTPAHLRDQAKQSPAYLVERMVTRSLLALEAEAWAKQNGKTGTPEALLDQYLSAKTPAATATEQEVQDFFNRNPGMFGNSKLAEVQEAIKSFLVNEKISQARESYRRSVGKRQNIRVSSSWMEEQYQSWAANPVATARASGKPTVAVFSVIGCCEKKMYPVSQELITMYGSEISVAFVHVRQDRVLCEMHGVFTMPVEIIYDAKGREVFRRQGPMTVEEILGELSSRGVKLASGAK
jgi:hypothetical protein